MTRELCWILLYTRPRAETWTEINVRKAGYPTLLPRLRQRRGFGPLFPRYVLAGLAHEDELATLRAPGGVLYIVHSGDAPAWVPGELVRAVRARMDARGLVHLDPAGAADPLFAPSRRERVRALLSASHAAVPTIA